MANIKQRRTFISYSRTNKDFALKLSKELRTSGFNIWLDLLDIPTGSRWDDEVEKALESCEIFMVILTPASSASDNVKDEIGYAIDTGKHILPVLLENAKVPLRLRRFQYVDFTLKNFEEGVESAKQLLTDLINETTIPREEISAVAIDRDVKVNAEADRKAKEEAEQAAKQKAEDERLAKAKAETERKARQEADRLTMQKAEADRKAKEEIKRVAKQKAEDERLAKPKAETELKAKLEADRLAAQKAEAERVAKQKAEAERLAKAKAETERKARLEADRLAAQKAEAERVAKQKAEDERLAKAKAETERKAKLEADRLAAQQAEEKAKAKPAPVMPAEMKAETVSATTTQKRSISRGLVIGVVAIVVLAIAGIAFGALSKNRSSTAVANPATEARVIENPATEVPVVASPATEATTVSSLFIPETSACETPTVSVKAKNVYLRDGPDIRFVALAQYKNGDQFTLLGRYRDWFQAEAADGKKGWVYKDWVTIPSTLDTSTICSIPVEELPPTPKTSQNDQKTPQSGEECVPTYYVSCP